MNPTTKKLKTMLGISEREPFLCEVCDHHLMGCTEEVIEEYEGLTVGDRLRFCSNWELREDKKQYLKEDK